MKGLELPVVVNISSRNTYKGFTTALSGPHIVDQEKLAPIRLSKRRRTIDQCTVQTGNDYDQKDLLEAC